MGLLDLFFPPKRKPPRRRRPPSSTRRSAAPSPSSKRADLDRQAAAWLRQDNARKRAELRDRERAARHDQQERIRAMRHEALLARRADAAYRRQKAALLRDGWSAAEAEELLTHYDVNPAATAGRIGLALAHLGLAALGVTRNPQLGAATDPRAIQESETFHGEGRSTAALSARERAGLPRDVVVVGRLESVSYKPLRGSKRGGSVWQHEAGDKGLFGGTAGKGRSLLVADPATGKVDIVGGPMRFRPSVGLYG